MNSGLRLVGLSAGCANARPSKQEFNPAGGGGKAQEMIG